MKQKKIIQWSLFTVLCLWGLYSFLILIGDEATDSPFTLGQFFILKTAAMINLIGCYHGGKWLHKRGLLPPEIENFIREEE